MAAVGWGQTDRQMWTETRIHVRLTLDRPLDFSFMSQSVAFAYIYLS